MISGNRMSYLGATRLPYSRYYYMLALTYCHHNNLYVNKFVVFFPKLMCHFFLTCCLLPNQSFLAHLQAGSNKNKAWPLLLQVTHLLHNSLDIVTNLENYSANHNRRRPPQVINYFLRDILP